jgi:hypothetical protein
VLLLAFLIVGTGSNALAWNAISHYHINRLSGVEFTPVFGVSGTGPDMSVQVIGDYPPVLDENNKNQSWADYFHSPDPRIENEQRPFADMPNFGYLMLAVANNNGAITEFAQAQALGWGGHIAADWVAHNKNLFPICPDGTGGSIKHFIGESLCEAYSFLTQGPLDAADDKSISFDDKNLYQALLNYRLIMLHDSAVMKHKIISDEELKQRALSTTLSRSCIRDRIKSWATKLAIMQFAYGKSIGSWDPVRRSLFLDSMKRKGVESNRALSEMAVYAWINNPTPRGMIPDYSEQVAPFYKEKLLSTSQQAATQARALGSEDRRASGFDQYTAQEKSIAVEAQDSNFWQGIIDGACNNEQVVVEETDTPDGLYSVNMRILDEHALWESVKASACNEVNMTDPGFSILPFWKRLLVDGIAEPDVLADIAPPRINIRYPLDGAFINTALPIINVDMADGLDGSGIDSSTLSISIDDNPCRHTLMSNTLTGSPLTKLQEGLHYATVAVSDRAGSTAQCHWMFTVDTIPPKPCYKVKNNTITLNKPKVAVAVLSNEPSSFCLVVYPVKSGRIDMANPVYGLRTGEGEEQLVSWNGTDNRGQKIADGIYMLKLYITDLAGNTRAISAQVKVDRD